MTDARITSFLVKVASRCNLDCDYCYVYHHADQSWRKMPKTMSAEVQAAFAARLREYVAEVGLKRAVVVFHGGEPLLAGVEAIVGFANNLRAAVGSDVSLEMAMQTNGLLLSDLTLDILEAADISVSLSLDGGREANDRHRVSRKGRSSYDRVMEGYNRLQEHPKIFAGVIAVIDPEVRPEELFSFFGTLNPPKLDFLLPDAHHLRPPPGRHGQLDRYQEWLVKAFDLWFDVYPHLPLRTFEALLDVAAGLPSATDAFGFGDVNLLSIETDGSYHDLDVLKITTDGATALPGSVRDAAISAVAASAGIERHRSLLRKEGLSAKCLSCTVVDICGGGSVPHRFGANGFDNAGFTKSRTKISVSRGHRIQKVRDSKFSKSRTEA
ncbi:cyclophane-forming radical SAM/SPASM peptide maturase YhhB, partial [Rhizobium sp. 23-156Da]